MLTDSVASPNNPAALSPGLLSPEQQLGPPAAPTWVQGAAEQPPAIPPAGVQMPPVWTQGAGGHDAGGAVAPLNVVFTGGGPAATSVINNLAGTLERHQQDIQQLNQAGGNFGLNITIPDKQQLNQLGMGTAFGPTQGTGLANTPFEVGYETQLTNYFNANKDQMVAEANQNNAGVVLANFQHIDQGLFPLADRAAMTRAHLGIAENQLYQSNVQAISEKFPGVQINPLPGHEVNSVDLSDPRHPVAQLTQLATGEPRQLRADEMHLTVGVSPANPISDPLVLPHTFSAPANRADIQQALAGKNLLDADGYLLPHKSVGIGGTSLSGMDMVLAHAAFLRGVEADPTSDTGFRISPQARQDYAGALQMIANTPGKFNHPRHSFTLNSADYIPKLMTPIEAHAQTLHQNGMASFTDGDTLRSHMAASAFGRTPDQMKEPSGSTLDTVREQHAGTAHMMEKRREAAALLAQHPGGLPPEQQARYNALLDDSTKTREGTNRLVQASFMLGGGGPDFASDLNQKAAEFPGTSRPVYHHFRLETAGPSDPYLQHLNGPGGTAPMDRSFGKAMSDITSGQSTSHAFIHQLAEAGILDFKNGNYNQLAPNADNTGLVFRSGEQTQPLDHFFVSPTFQPRQDPVLQSLQPQVKPVPGARDIIPEVTQGRRIVDKDNTVSNVFDWSMNSMGTRSADGRSTLRKFAADPNNRESWTLSQERADHLVGAAALNAAGIPSPTDAYFKLVQDRMVSPDQYAEEVSRLKEPFENAQAKARVLEETEDTLRNDPEFAALVQKYGPIASSMSGAAVPSGAVPSLPPTADGMYLRGVGQMHSDGWGRSSAARTTC